ncbi:MAG: GGDEF domain-containing protein [Magnetococcales bacterium]|nr:GGDEF domain-containing protein [Magnetococcales bacterium]
MTLLTDTSLAEQLKITERSILERKHLFSFSDEDVTNLLAAKPYIEENLDTIVEAFYEEQLRHSDVELVIGDADTLMRLKNAMRGYIQDLFSGTYDTIYINRRLRVGKIHQRIGVPPALYMSAVQLLLSHLVSYMETQCNDGACSRYEVEARKVSLTKLLMFDVQLVFETYTSSLVFEVEKARNKLEIYAEELEATVAKRTQELQDLSQQDGLTGLLNQRAFYEHLRSELSHAARRHWKVTLVYFDLNSFKKLNDTQGHRAGDLLLAHVGEAMLGTVRDVDSACRYGGDEFCIIMPETSEKQAEEVCRRLAKRFIAKAGMDVTFSIGIAETGTDTYLSEDDMVKLADKLMYKSKKGSKETPGHWCCCALSGEAEPLLNTPAEPNAKLEDPTSDPEPPPSDTTEAS